MASDTSPDGDGDHAHPRDREISMPPRLNEVDRQHLAELVSAAIRADGVGPLSEHALLHLRDEAGDHAHHLLLHEGGTLVAAAHVDLGDAGEPASAELVVRPDRRRRGSGSAVLGRLEQLAEQLRVWAHGDLPAARGFAAHHSYAAVRELWLMSRSLHEPLPAAPIPDGFTLRGFRPVEDESAWLAVNAASFANHPEQGAWRRQDLTQRMEEPWFDPEGLLLLVDNTSGALAGFHWTKVHVEQHVGEVYVVAVAPTYQGRGLAKPLTLAGLRHLRRQGLPEVMLYVDGENSAAVGTYSGLGFTRAALDVQYAAADPPRRS